MLPEMSGIEWDRETYAQYQDFAALPLLALFFPSIRFFLDRFIFGKLGKRFIVGSQRCLDDEIHEKRRKLKKFKESAWKFIYFLSAEILALVVTYSEPWFTNSKFFWVGPGEQVWPDQKIKLKLKGLYMYAAGFYIYSIFALIFWETRRSDFGVSMAHHVATLILIVLSYIFRFARVGSVVLALHDASDVFLEIGKMSKYCGAESVASFAFILFVLSWVILRLVYYPLWILWSTRKEKLIAGEPSYNALEFWCFSFHGSYEVLLTLDKEKHKVEGPIYYYVFNSLLFCLLVLHFYWWVLMYRMLVRQIEARGQLGDDVRSDSEGEDNHDD
ncbi:ASC1-like protein isoform X1 [Amborella trichopoda]|uniref:ASC1-like protein isoform X1 n=1 Tax=Amborella trichopoda TaxID=13333 RepID=UPI0009C14698|nr:ASC1-like protein isoform X1 [Amborella trichopoda]|eukprot:XP_020522817.1 ASC1-like protein isoform X1 [Amborella trichopoda]